MCLCVASRVMYVALFHQCCVLFRLRVYVRMCVCSDLQHPVPVCLAPHLVPSHTHLVQLVVTITSSHHRPHPHMHMHHPRIHHSHTLFPQLHTNCSLHEHSTAQYTALCRRPHISHVLVSRCANTIRNLQPARRRFCRQRLRSCSCRQNTAKFKIFNVMKFENEDI